MNAEAVWITGIGACSALGPDDVADVQNAVPTADVASAMRFLSGQACGTGVFALALLAAAACGGDDDPQPHDSSAEAGSPVDGGVVPVRRQLVQVTTDQRGQARISDTGGAAIDLFVIDSVTQRPVGGAVVAST